MNNDFYFNNLMGDLVGTEQEDLDRSRETITRDLEREQAGAQVDKLETEINDCECAAQIHKCTICWDKMTLINEIDKKYGLK